MKESFQRSVKFVVVCLVLLAAILFSSNANYAQTAAAGTITGEVRDPKGLLVVGATILIHNTDTGIDRNLVTNDAGLYYAAFVQPGHYEVTASKEGFTTVVRKELTLHVGENLPIDFSLSVHSESTSITVTGELPLIDPDKTEFSEMVSDNLVQNLPINGRRWENFALLTPGTTTDGGSGLISYRGISGLYNSTSVDGANNNQAFFSESKGRTTVPYVYSMDSLKEFQVASSNYSAEFGQAAGGQVNAITKSGGNDIHGDLFYYLRYPGLNALDPINKANHIFTQPIHQQQQFGGSVGGPIINDRLFYFFTYDGSRKVYPIAYTSTAGSSLPLACPTVATPDECASANGYISSLLTSYPRTANQDVYFGKIDFQADANNHFSLGFNMDNFRSPNSYNTATTSNNNSITANGSATTHERILVGTWSSTLSNATVNEARFQWSRDLETISANAPGPSTTLTNITAYGMPNALPRPAFPDEHRIQISDVVSTVRGKHTLKAGFDLNMIHELLINLFQGGGIYGYSSPTAGITTSPAFGPQCAGSTGGVFCDWIADVYGLDTGDGLVGHHWTTFTQVTDPITGVGKDDFWDNDVAGFVEDTWKIRPNLTLNLGLRYDIQMVPQPHIPNTISPIATLYSSNINIDTNNFGPRLGIAWQPFKHVVVRSGYGIFYGKTTNSTYYAIRVENGVYQQQFVCKPTDPCGPGFPNVIFPAPGPALAAPFPGALVPQVINTNPPASTLVVHGLAPDFVNPLVHEGEFGIEAQLPWNLTVSGTYLFSRALHLPVFLDTNLAAPTQAKTYAFTTPSGDVVNDTEPFYATSASDGSILNGGRLFSQPGAVLTGFSVLNSWYNGVAITVKRPAQHGVEFLFNYTLSKAIDGGEVPGQFGTFYGTDSPIDPLNLKRENGLSDLDQRQRFVGSVSWRPMYFHNLSSRALRYLLDDYTFASIFTVASGQPVTGQISTFQKGSVDGGVTGAEVSNSASPIGGRIPFLGRNTFTGPDLRAVDLRISKDIPIHERFRLQLIGEAFNLFNHTNYFSVNTTAYSYSSTNAASCGMGGNPACVLTPVASFLQPTVSTNNLYGARVLQVSAKLFF